MTNFIQPLERLLIEIDCGDGKIDGVYFPGPMSLSQAKKEYAGCDALVAFRIDPLLPNIEDITEDLAEVNPDYDPSIARHERSMKDTKRFI